MGAGGGGDGGGQATPAGFGGFGYGKGKGKGRSDPEGTDTGGFGYGGSAVSGRGGVAVAPGAKDAAKETPSAIARALGLSDAIRQSNFNNNAALDAEMMAGNRPEPNPTPEPVAAPAPKPQPRPQPTPTAAPPPVVSKAPEPAFDAAAYMADIQAKYDEQLKVIQGEIAAADAARAAQLDELTKATEDKKKKIKSPRKLGRLSLLSGSELGIPKVTTLGTASTPG